MIKAKVSLDWDAIRKAIEEGRIKFDPPALTSHFREEMMKAYD